MAVRVFPLLGTAVALLGLFALAEWARRRGLKAETTRRVVHVAGAGTTALFPLYLQLNEVVALAIGFTVFLGWTRVRGSLNSVHAVDRPTLGAVVFPLGLLLAAIAVWSHPAAFSFAALVLAFADPAASLVGKRLNSLSWPVSGGRKSLLGSLAFFAVALALGTVFASVAGTGAILAVLGAAALLTAVEATLGFGLDNLVIPLVAGLLGEQWLRI
jgi:phytol kinase